MFSGLKFRGKLALAIVPAMLALAILAWASVAPRLQRSSNAGDDLQRITTSVAVMELFDEAQLEMGLSARAVNNPEVAIELSEQRAVVDQRGAAALRSLDGIGQSGTGGRVDDFRAFIASLGQIRSDIDSGSSSMDVEGVVEAFDEGLDLGVRAIRQITTATTDAALLRNSNSILEQLTGKEKYGETLALIAGLLETEKIDPEDVDEIAEEFEAAKSAYLRFSEVAAPADVELLRQVESDPSVADLAVQVEAIIANAAAGEASRAPAADWWAASMAALASYDRLDDQMFDNYRQTANNAHDSSQRSAIIFFALAALASIFAGVVAFVIGRDLVRRVSQISDAAHTIAVDRLPEVLEALRNPTPEALAGAMPRVETPSTDEIGSLAESFNTVLRTSVQTSIEHSQRRSETLTNLLINLGRRNQSIIERQLQLIDTMESREQDPEVLEGLFKLDHLVTRQRRNAESLLVLAGSRRSRAWTAPVPTSDVIRGAVSEVADMNRVNSEMPPGHDLLVSGQYAVDLSHLLAELVENATQYSNPSTQVVVRAQRSGMNLRLWVIDNGVGMSDEELEVANSRVSDPPDIDEIATDQVGFQVVGRLARRLEARVRLQNNPAGGIAVSIDLPPAVFEPTYDDLSPAARAEAQAQRHAEGEHELMVADHGDDFDFGDLSDGPDFDQELQDLVFAGEMQNEAAANQASTERAQQVSPVSDTRAPKSVAPVARAVDPLAPKPRLRTEVSTIPTLAGQGPPDGRGAHSPSRAASTPPRTAQARPTAETSTVRIVSGDAPESPRQSVSSTPDDVAQTSAGLVKRRPGAALSPERTVAPIGLFKAGETADNDDDVAESRLKSLRAFTRGVDQGRGDA